VQGCPARGGGVAAETARARGERRVLWRAQSSHQKVWLPDLGKLRWERLSDLAASRAYHASCAVRKGVVALGGNEGGRLQLTASVEGSGYDLSRAATNIFYILPPLSCGPISSSAAVVIDESESDRGHVLVISGWGESEWVEGAASSAVCKVDLATGACTARPFLL